ncbi:MAG: hypothetical protein HYV16_12185 [Gammaproteobacteria bacterium]|nr:hypothetical protein [Gammaproteobacteria bacterium]
MEKLTGKLWLLSSSLLAASTSFAIDVPEMLKDINQVPHAVAAQDIGPFEVQSHLGKVFMLVNDGQHGREPWVYDPQTGVAELLAETGTGRHSLFEGDIGWSQGLEVSATSRYVLLQPKRLPDFVSTSDKIYWISDGTKEGTWSLDEVTGSTRIQNVAVKSNDHIFLKTENGCWETDGTRAGTKPIDRQAWDDLAYSIWFQGAYYFVHYEDVAGSSQLTLMSRESAVVSAKPLAALAPLGKLSFDLYGMGKVATSDAVYFSVQDGFTGHTTLWRSNGTAAGTVSLLTPEADAERLYLSSDDFVAVGKYLYFPWRTRAAGTELWTTDGTAGGTRMVTDYAPGAANGLDDSSLEENDSFEDEVAVVGEELISGLQDPSGASHLVRIGAGGGSVTELGLSNAHIGIVEDASSQGKVFAFSRSDATGESLWVVPPGGNAVKLRDFASGERVEDDWMAGSRLYLEVKNDQGTQILSTDGGDAGLKTIALESGWYLPEDLASVDDQLFIGPSQYGNEASWGKLWQVDGAAGSLTSAVGFSVTGNGDSDPEHFVKLGDATYFLADDGVHGRELWLTDGTAPGTRMVADVRVGLDSAFDDGGGWGRLSTAILNGKLYFVADDGIHGAELWKTDGTAAGTLMVGDIRPGPDGALEGMPNMTSFKGRIYFRAVTAEAGIELWSSDGTAEGTSLLKDLSPGQGNSWPWLENGAVYSGEYQDQLYFSAYTPATGQELWRTDGTAEGTVLFSDIIPGPASSYPARFKALGGKLYLRTHSNNYTEQALRVTDGTPESVQLLYQATGVSAERTLSYIRELNGSVVFAAPNVELGFELWMTGGTPETTHILKDVMPGAGDGFGNDMAIVGNRLYFAGSDGEHGLELWVSDGSAEGTRLLEETMPGAGDGLRGGNNGLVRHKDTAYFLANDQAHGSEFWRVKADGSGIERATDHFIPEEVTMSYPISIGESLMFAASADEFGMELWQLRDVNSAPTIASIAAQTINAGAVATVSLSLADAESAAADLQVSVSSSNTELAPVSALVISGSGASRSLAITPAAGKSGSASITVTVSDGQAQASTQFMLTVNAAPTPTPTPSSGGGGGGGALAWLLLALSPLAFRERAAAH